jgi:hypothetical protein
VIPTDLQSHARVNLQKFIGKEKNFCNGDVQRDAQRIYTKLLGFEKELKSTISGVRTYLTISAPHIM